MVIYIMEGFFLITFKNTYDALSTEGFLKSKGITHRVVPTPASITGSCGISIKINPEQAEEIRFYSLEKAINVKALYYKDDTGYSIVE